MLSDGAVTARRHGATRLTGTPGPWLAVPETRSIGDDRVHRASNLHRGGRSISSHARRLWQLATSRGTEPTDTASRSPACVPGELGLFRWMDRQPACCMAASGRLSLLMDGCHGIRGQGAFPASDPSIPSLIKQQKLSLALRMPGITSRQRLITSQQRRVLVKPVAIARRWNHTFCCGNAGQPE